MTQGYGELGSQQSGIETHRGDSDAINHFADSIKKPAQKPLGGISLQPPIWPMGPPQCSHALLYVLHRQFTVCVPTGGECMLLQMASEHTQRTSWTRQNQKKAHEVELIAHYRKSKWESSSSQPGSAGWKEDIHSKELSHHQEETRCVSCHIHTKDLWNP